MLEQDPPGFTFDEQYRVVSWKAYFETLKLIGKESAALKDSSGAQVFIRDLSRQALRDILTWSRKSTDLVVMNMAMFI
jgi:hypothetical protein